MLKDLASLSETEWFARLEEMGETAGAFVRLGRSHSALFVDRGETLIVSFESYDSIRLGQPDQRPLGLSVADGRGWSSLTLIAREDTWYRDRKIYAYFDRLTDDGFFESFDRVVFHGAGMAAYAAAAYSVASPGATLLLVQPQATLDPAVAGWDPRFSEYRRLCFTDRYGYAPDMIDGAREVFVIFDPDQPYDAMHAALFRRPFTTFLPCRHLGPEVARSLKDMHVLPSALTAAGSGAFDARLFWAFYRARRNYLPYLRRVLSRLESDGRPRLAAMLAGHVAGRLDDRRMSIRAAELASEVERLRRR